jgi:glutathione synthase/RimK-type ligase-like ATP-grasp enzyme
MLCWERREVHSWNPVLARMLRNRGVDVAEVCDLRAIAEHEASDFDVALPRFRTGAADMACLDELLVRSRVPMLNSRECRQACENKALAHLAFEQDGLPQPPALVVSREGVADRAPGWKGETVVKPLHGCRGIGIEVHPDVGQAIGRARARREDLLVQQMVWPARCWRVIVGRTVGVVDPYWRRPPRPDDRILSISTGSTIVRDHLSSQGDVLAQRMLRAVGGDLLAVDLLETTDGVLALEINHNFDAHGGDEPAVAAFSAELEAIAGGAGPGRRAPAAQSRARS